MTKSIFRCLVLVSFLANLIWMFFRDVYWEKLDVNVRNLLGADGYGSILPGAEYLFWVIMTAGLVCYIGLFLLRRWAVFLLLFLDVVVLFLLAPFGGVEVSLPAERLAKAVFLMSDGAIIGVALLSDFKNQLK